VVSDSCLRSAISWGARVRRDKRDLPLPEMPDGRSLSRASDVHGCWTSDSGNRTSLKTRPAPGPAEAYGGGITITPAAGIWELAFAFGGVLRSPALSTTTRANWPPEQTGVSVCRRAVAALRQSRTVRDCPSRPDAWAAACCRRGFVGWRPDGPWPSASASTSKTNPDMSVSPHVSDAVYHRREVLHAAARRLVDYADEWRTPILLNRNARRWCVWVGIRIA
jgi:hypothetical protein